jgi:hypothetical protein
MPKLNAITINLVIRYCHFELSEASCVSTLLSCHPKSDFQMQDLGKRTCGIHPEITASTAIKHLTPLYDQTSYLKRVLDIDYWLLIIKSLTSYLLPLYSGIQS